MVDKEWAERAQHLAHQVRELAEQVGDPTELWIAYGLAEDLDRALVAAGQRLHENGASYTALGNAFRITRQAALKKWPRLNRQTTDGIPTVTNTRRIDQDSGTWNRGDRTA